MIADRCDGDTIPVDACYAVTVLEVPRVGHHQRRAGTGITSRSAGLNCEVVRLP